MNTERDNDVENQECLEHRIAALLLRLTEMIVQIRTREGLSQKELMDLLGKKRDVALLDRQGRIAREDRSGIRGHPDCWPTGNHAK